MLRLPFGNHYSGVHFHPACQSQHRAKAGIKETMIFQRRYSPSDCVDRRSTLPQDLRTALNG